MVLQVLRGVEVFHVLVGKPERACAVRVHPREWDHAHMSMEVAYMNFVTEPLDRRVRDQESREKRGILALVGGRGS